MKIVPPLSIEGRCRDYAGNLPSPSAELNGQLMATGFPTYYLVYRCHFNEREPEKSGWSFLYFWMEP